MQEKVQSTPPPEIKLFEGKAPPTSWVNDNIVEYLQTQSQASFLTSVLGYVKSLQQQQLIKSRSQPLKMTESFVAIPDKGTKEQVSTTALFNATQENVKTEIATFGLMLALLQQGNLDLASKLKPIFEQLQQCAQAFPKLSPQQLQNLNSILQQLTQYAKQLSPEYQKAFLNLQLQMLRSMNESNKENIQDNETDIASMQQGKTQPPGDLAQKILQALSKTPIKLDGLKDLIGNLQKLVNLHSNADPQQQQAIAAFLTQLGQYQTGKGENLSSILARSIIQTKIQEFLKSKPHASSSEIQAYLKSFLQKSNLNQSELPFMKSIGQSIEDILDEQGFPASNDQELQNTIQGYAPDAQSVKNLQKAAERLETDEQKESDQAVVAGLKEANHSLKDLQNKIGQAAIMTAAQSAAVPAAGAPPAGGSAVQAGSIPNIAQEFKDIILNKYMVEQEKMMEVLAFQLFIANMGAGIGNDLGSITIDFGQADTSYNFGRGLTPSSTSGEYVGTPSSAQQALSAEKAQCSQDINNVNNAIDKINQKLGDIQKQIDQINGNKDLSPSQKADMIQKLTDMKNSLLKIQTNLQASLPSLEALKAKLGTITIQNGSTPNTFKISPTESIPELKQDEGAVSHGPPGTGLSGINSSIQDFATDWSGQSMTQQQQLQLVMTEMQQQWTVVSSALQILNQMYMVCADAIYH